jgi:O-antigen/teichoic acid export membrane protein
MSGVPSDLVLSDKHVNVTRGVSYLILQSVGINAITMISFIVLARLISTLEMGIYAVLLLINATCLTFFTWFPQAVIKFVAENISLGFRSVAAGAFYKALVANVVISAPVAAAIYVGASFLSSHLLGNPALAPLFQILAFDIFISAGLLQILTAALLGLHMFRETAIIGLVVGGVIRQILIISLIIILKSFAGLVIAWVVSDAGTAVIYLVLTVRALGAPRFDFPLIRLFRYHLPLQLQGITTYAQSWFDRALLLVFVPLATLGIYNAALTAFGVLTGVTTAMTNVLFPAYSSIHEKTEVRVELGRSIRLAARYSSLVLTPLGFGLLATAKPALVLFVGESYVAGSLPLAIFCGAFAITAFTVALAPAFLALEETKLFAWINGSGVVISLAVAYSLLPEWGTLGAAAARAFAMIFAAVLTIIFLRRKITLQLDLRTIATHLFAGGTMALVILAVELVKYSNLLLPLYVLLGSVVYSILLRLLKAVDASDMYLLSRFLGKSLLPVSQILSWILVGPGSGLPNWKVGQEENV